MKWLRMRPRDMNDLDESRIHQEAQDENIDEDEAEADVEMDEGNGGGNGTTISAKTAGADAGPAEVIAGAGADGTADASVVAKRKKAALRSRRKPTGTSEEGAFVESGGAASLDQTAKVGGSSGDLGQNMIANVNGSGAASVL